MEESEIRTAAEIQRSKSPQQYPIILENTVSQQGFGGQWFRIISICVNRFNLLVITTFLFSVPNNCIADTDGIPTYFCLSVRDYAVPAASELSVIAMNAFKDINPVRPAEVGEVRFFQSSSKIGFFINKKCIADLCPIVMLRKKASKVDKFYIYFFLNVSISMQFPDDIGPDNLQHAVVTIVGLSQKTQPIGIEFSEDRDVGESFNWNRFLMSARIGLVPQSLNSRSTCQTSKQPGLKNQRFE